MFYMYCLAEDILAKFAQLITKTLFVFVFCSCKTSLGSVSLAGFFLPPFQSAPAIMLFLLRFVFCSHHCNTFHCFQWESCYPHKNDRASLCGDISNFSFEVEKGFKPTELCIASGNVHSNTLPFRRDQLRKYLLETILKNEQ